MHADFPLASFFAIFTLRRLVDDFELGHVSVPLFAVHLRCAFDHFRTFSSYWSNSFCSSTLFEEKNEIGKTLDEIRAFFVDLGQAVGHPMHGNLLGLLVTLLSCHHLLLTAIHLPMPGHWDYVTRCVQMRTMHSAILFLASSKNLPNLTLLVL